jgi:hypothetical protein
MAKQMVFNAFLKWVTSSEVRPHIALKATELDALTQVYIEQQNTKGLLEILKELDYRKFAKIAVIKSRIEDHLNAPDLTIDPRPSIPSEEELNNAAQQESGGGKEESTHGREISFLELQIDRKFTYILICEDSDALYMPVRDQSGICIRINQNNVLGRPVYNLLKSKESRESRLLASLLEALAECEIEEVGMKRAELAALRRTIGKKIMLKQR